MKLRINIGYGVIAITYVVVLLSILLGCHPLHKNWQIHPDPGSMFWSWLVMLFKFRVSLLNRPLPTGYIAYQPNSHCCAQCLDRSLSDLHSDSGQTLCLALMLVLEG